MNEAMPQYTTAQLRAALYRDHPELLNGLRRTLGELLAIARTYAPLQKYDVTQHALGAIGELLSDYLRVRNEDLIMPTSLNALAGSTDFLFDSVLTESLEGISSLNKAGVGRGDVQLSQQIIGTLESLTLKSIDTRSLVSPPGENPVAGFVHAFMSLASEQGAIGGMDDITMTGARAGATIGQALLRKQLFLTAQTTIADVEKLAYFGIMQRKPHVTGAAVKGIAEMLSTAISQPVIRSHTIQAALTSLRQVCVAELQYKTAPLDQSLRFSIGPFLDPTQPSALIHTSTLAVNQLASAMEETDFAKTSDCQEAIRELQDELAEHLSALGTAAAATESFALFYINAIIAEIARQDLWLYHRIAQSRREAVDSTAAHEQSLTRRFAEHLLDRLRWIVGVTYWRIFDALKTPINTLLVWDFFPTLADIGIRALDVGADTVTESIIDELKQIAFQCIDKPIQSYRSAARVAVFIARMGIIAQKLERSKMLDHSVKALKEFNDRYFKWQRERQPDNQEYEAILLNELRRLEETLERGNWYIDEEDAAFFSRISADDIRSFVARLSEGEERVNR